MKTRTKLLVSVLFVLVAPFVAFADDPAEDLFVDAAGVLLRYTDQGAGDPIVLIHGFTSSIESNWGANGIIDRLKADFRVIALDARGHGKSGKPHDPAAYGARMAEDVVSLLDHLKIDKAHVVGYSMGGFITLKLLTLHPERLLSAVLGGAGWNEPGTEPSMIELAESLEQGNGISPLIKALTPTGQPLPSDEQLEMINAMVLATNDPLALAAVIRGMDGLQVERAELAATEVPILAVIGEIDPLRATVDSLKEVVPAVEIVVLEGRDHMTAIADPRLVESIRDFFIRLCQCA